MAFDAGTVPFACLDPRRRKLDQSLEEVSGDARAAFENLPAGSRELIAATLRWDPRPAFHQGGRVYHATMAGVDVDWDVQDGICRILGVRNSR